MYASPRTDVRLEDCHFYHVMEIPGHGLVGRDWDLRGGEGAYLGNVALAGRRVLEIGPASGFLTFHMESRGAEVVAVELAPNIDWDIVPHAALDLDRIREDRTQIMERLRNGFWFAHERFASTARVHYGSAYDLPAELGRFDVAVMGSVLLHTRDPLRVVENCARLADTVVIADLRFPELDGSAVARFVPSATSDNWDLWWQFSPDLFVQVLQVMGFDRTTVTHHDQRYVANPDEVRLPLFTVVASRSGTTGSTDAVRSSAASLPAVSVGASSGPRSDAVEHAAPGGSPASKAKVIVVMPALNAARTLRRTVAGIPREVVDEVILVDDRSTDNTVDLARQLPIHVIWHPHNVGYGGNQKTCYLEALQRGADVVVMLHPDGQYEPSLIPALIAPILEGEADLVLGSRLAVPGMARAGGMPIYKILANRGLTMIENRVLGTGLSEMHTGYRAYSRDLLLTVPFLRNSIGFSFDSELIMQAVHFGFRVREIPAETRYFSDASSIDLKDSVVYGLKTLATAGRLVLHRAGLRSRRFES